MKLLRLLLTSLLIVAASFGSQQNDPFEPQGAPEWLLETIPGKPYQLEVAYGEYELLSTDPNFELETELDPKFLESATRLSIATSSNESGQFSEKAKHTVKYRIAENSDGSFDLKIHLKALDGGLRETNTDITVNESKWIVLSGLTQQSDDGTRLVYTTAIRLTPKADQSEDL